MSDDIHKDWAHLIDMFLNRDENTSPALFCETHGVSIYEMDRHYREFMKDTISTQEAPCFEVTTDRRKSPYLILDVNSVRIKVYHGFDHALLKEVLEVIQC